MTVKNITFSEKVVPFFTPVKFKVSDKDNKNISIFKRAFCTLGAAADEYLSLSAHSISYVKCSVKVGADESYRVFTPVNKFKYNGSKVKNIALNVLKIVSYASVALPLVALVIKIAYKRFITNQVNMNIEFNDDAGLKNQIIGSETLKTPRLVNWLKGHFPEQGEVFDDYFKPCHSLVNEITTYTNYFTASGDKTSLMLQGLTISENDPKETLVATLFMDRVFSMLSQKSVDESNTTYAFGSPGPFSYDAHQFYMKHFKKDHRHDVCAKPFMAMWHPAFTISVAKPQSMMTIAKA